MHITSGRQTLASPSQSLPLSFYMLRGGTSQVWWSSRKTHSPMRFLTNKNSIEKGWVQPAGVWLPLHGADCTLQTNGKKGAIHLFLALHDILCSQPVCFCYSKCLKSLSLEKNLVWRKPSQTQRQCSNIPKYPPYSHLQLPQVLQKLNLSDMHRKQLLLWSRLGHSLLLIIILHSVIINTWGALVLNWHFGQLFFLSF